MTIPILIKNSFVGTVEIVVLHYDVMTNWHTVAYVVERMENAPVPATVMCCSTISLKHQPINKYMI